MSVFVIDFFELIDVSDRDAKRHSSADVAFDHDSLHAKAAAKPGKGIAGGDLLGLFQLCPVGGDLLLELVDGGLAFLGHSVDGSFQFGGAFLDRGADFGEVVQAGDRGEACCDLVDLPAQR